MDFPGGSVKNPLAMQETWVWSLGWEDTMEKGKAIHSRVLTWRIHGVLDVQAGFRKGGGTRDQITNILWIIKKANEFQKNIYFCFIDYANAFDCVDHNCGKFLKKWNYQTALPASWEICMQVRKLKLDIEQWTGSK